MHFPEWLVLFWQQVKETPLLQWMGVGFGIAEVLLARANKISLYPCGIISILISLYALFESKLYAECVLNLYYLVMSIYGWWHWVKRKGQPAVEVSYATTNEWLATSSIVLLAFGILWFSLARFTDSAVPVWDAWVSATAWGGMWLLARRKIENWILLNISNAFAIPLLVHKHLPMYAVLTIILFIVAIFGYFDWRKKIQKRYYLNALTA